MRDPYDEGTLELPLAYRKARNSVPADRRVPLTDLIRRNMVICPPMHPPVPCTLTTAMKEVLTEAGLD